MNLREEWSTFQTNYSDESHMDLEAQISLASSFSTFAPVQAIASPDIVGAEFAEVDMAERIVELHVELLEQQR